MSISSAVETMDHNNPKHQIAVLRERLDSLEKAIDSNNPGVSVIALFIDRTSKRLVSIFVKPEN